MDFDAELGSGGEDTGAIPTVVAMRVAFITHEPFFPPSGGGSAEAVYLVREFKNRGHEVHVFCPNIPDAEAVEKQFEIRLHLFRKWEMGRYTSFRSAKYLLYPSAIQRLVEAEAQTTPFDLLFSQHAISAVAAGRLKQTLRVPVVMNFLDYLTGFMETWPAYLAPRPVLAQLKKYELSLPNRYAADGVLTVSDTLADYFAHVGYPRERIQPIYYGYDSNFFPLRPESVAQAADRLPTIVMHGSLDYHHLNRVALDAIVFVVQNRPDAVFKFVGQETAALRKFLTQLGRRCPAALVECTGFVPYNEVARHLSECSIGVVPYEESVGTHCAFVAKIVEYLAVGLPVVSTPLDSAVRYFGDEPTVRFSEFDGISFGRKVLSWLLGPPELRQHFARAASERVQQGLDWRMISQRALDFVEWIGQQPRE
jgi:glycosyltransferase involved in cell wall biosynthesis